MARAPLPRRRRPKVEPPPARRIWGMTDHAGGAMTRALLPILAALLCLAPPRPAAAGTEGVTAFALDNGLEVVVIEDHTAPAVTHMIWYRAGAADEPPGRSGIAHFLEHLMFKGTEAMPDGAFSDLIAAHGGTENAFTSWDYTAYFQTVAADRLGLMMRHEADRMANLRLSPEDVTTERGVILEERNQRVENDPGALFFEQKRAALFLNHPYGVPIIGWRHEIAALDRDAALDFYRDHYAPNNAILVVAGDTDPAEVRALAEASYGLIPANPDVAPRLRPAEPPQLAERRVIFEDARVARPYVTRSYLAPARAPGDQAEAAALTVLAQLLGQGGVTGRLGATLQLRDGIAVQAGASYRATALDATSFDLYVMPAEGVSLADAEAALDRELAAFLAEGPDPARLARVKARLAAERIYELDSIAARARRHGAALASGLTPDDVAEWPAAIDAVTAEDLVAAARRLFDRRAAVTGIFRAPAEIPAEAVQ
jgi:zinc protease